MSDATPSYVRHDLFIWVTWLMCSLVPTYPDSAEICVFAHVCDMMHSYV